LLFAFSVVAAACGPADDAAAPDEVTEPPVTAEETPAPDAEGPRGGVLIWAHEQEPPDLHLDDPANNLTITAWIRQGMLDGLYGIDSATTYYPELLDGDAELTQNDDGTVTIAYTLRDGLSWSDGEPLTANDVLYTYNIFAEGCARDDDGSIAEGGEGCVYLLGDRTGYDMITDFTVNSDTEFTITMNQFFAGWQGLFVEVYAEHAYGADAAAVNDNLREMTGPDGPLPASGPMVFSTWNRGVSLELVRNDNYHGSVSPDARNTGVAFVDGVRINFVADTEAQINALRAGEAHIIMTQPQLEFERLADSPDFTVASSAGPVFEHWGFNLLNVHLSKPEVREAMAYAVDKGEVMAGLYTPLFGDTLPAEGLGNTYWMSNQPAYVDHQAQYHGAQFDRARELLESVGYVEGADGIYEHPQDGRLTLRVGTTGGNALRELQQQLIQEQVRGAGIEITIDNVPGGAYFAERPFAEAAIAASLSGGAEGDPTVWDITQFAWVGGPWPGGQSAAYRSTSSNNPYGFRNAAFDARSVECDATVDDDERAACYNELDRYVTTLEMGDDGLFMLPLTQKPSFYGYLSSQLQGAGAAPDANNAGPLSHVFDFQFRS
jgi:peptide/nickel transport system substrate-binding protein